MERMLPRSRLSPYVFTVVAVAIALALSLLLRDIIERTPFLLFWPVVVVSGWYGGRWAGVLATALTVLAATYFLQSSQWPYDLDSSSILATAIFLFVSILVSGFSSARRQAEEEAQEARDWLSVTLSSIGDAVIATDTEGRITFINPITSALTGWGQQEAVGEPISEVFRVINQQTRQPVESPVVRVLAEGAIVGLANHSVLIARDGTERPVDDSGAPIRDREGNIIGAVLVFRDVSERKRAQQKQAELAAIVQSSDDAIISKNLDGIILSWNPGAEQIYGYRAEEVIGHHISLLVPPDQPDEIPRIMERLNRGEHIDHYETQRVTKDGRRLDVSLSISPIRDSTGRIVAAAKIARDVTERKRAEAALRASEARFRMMADTVPGCVWTAKPDGSIDYANKYWYDFSGLTEAQTAGLEWGSILHPDDQERTLDAWTHAVQTGTPYELEARNRRADGQWRWLLNRAVPMKNDQDQITGWVGTSMDVTDMKEAQETLRRSEAQFRLLLESAPEAIIISNQDGRMILVNARTEQTFGYAREELLGKPIEMLLPDRFRKGHVAHRADYIAAPSARLMGIGRDLTGRRKDGSEFPIEVGLNLVETPEGPYVVSFIADITARKLAEAALRESEERLRTVLENMPVMLAASSEGMFIVWNRECERVTGYSSAEVVGNPHALELLFPDAQYREQTVNYWRDHDGDLRDFEVIFATREGDRRHVSWSSISRQFPVTGWVSWAVGVNITPRKRAEERLERERNLLQTILDAIPVMIVLYEPNTNIVRLNPEFERLTGWTAEEAQGISLMEEIYPDPEYRAMVRRYMESVEPGWHDRKMRTRDGRVIESSWANIRLADNTQIGIGIDITARKQAEAALHESEARYRTLFDDSPVALSEQDYSEVKTYIEQLHAKGVEDVSAYLDEHPEEIAVCLSKVRLTDANKADIALYKANSREDLLTTPKQVVPEAAMPMQKVILLAIAEGRTKLDAELLNQTFTGEEIWIAFGWLVAAGYEDSYGKVLVSMTDITEQKRAEAALYESETRYRMLFEDSPVSLWEQDYSELKAYLEQLQAGGVEDLDAYLDQHPEEIAACINRIRVLGVNKAAVALYGADSKDDLLSRLVQVVPPEALAMQKGFVLAVAEGRLKLNEELFNRTLTGEEKWIALSWSVVAGYEDTYGKVLVSIMDITERKQAEQRAEILHQLTAALSGALTPAQVAEVVVSRGVATLGGNLAVVCRLEGTQIEILNARGVPEHIHERYRNLTLDFHLPITDAMRSQQPVWIETLGDYIAAYPHLKDSLQATGSKAVAAIPLVVHGQTLGGIGVSFPHHRTFGDEERSFILALAQQCTQALERARLYQAEQSAREAAEARAARIARLQAVTAALSEAHNAKEIAQVVVYEGLIALKAAIGAVNLLVDDDTFEVLYTTSSRLAADEQERWQHFLADPSSPVADAILKRRSLWLESLEDRNSYYPTIGALSDIYPGAWAIVPLLVGEAAIGAVGWTFDHDRTFNEEERAFMMALAQQCALALERARLIEQEKHRAVLEERQRIARDLHDAVSQTLFAANVMAQSLPRLWERRPQTIPGRLDELARLTQGAASEMRVLLLELRPTVLLESNLPDLLGQLVQIARARSRQMTITFTFEGAHTLPPDVHLTFYRVAQETLNNIIKHSAASQVVVHFASGEGRAELSISDNGKGFNVNDPASSGFGLAMMRERAQEIGAILHMTSETGQGTEVALAWEVERSAEAVE